MKKLIYQVALGPKHKLYEHCIESVAKYADRIGADHIVQREPILRIAPNPFMSNRECKKTNGWKKLGYMPIFEKENVFNYFDDYDMCCVIDADIYIRETALDIFDYLPEKIAVGSVYESDVPINEEYMNKIKQYSRMIQLFNMPWPMRKKTGFDFFNSGVMLYNSRLMKKALKGKTPKQFLEQPQLQDLINGKGPFKWQSDQITLNYWFAVNHIPVHHLPWVFNALYAAIPKVAMKDAQFIHFFLKDHLPDNGNDIEALMKDINDV